MEKKAKKKETQGFNHKQKPEKALKPTS